MGPRRILVTAAALSALVLPGCAGLPSGPSSAAATGAYTRCADYHSRRQAERAWRASGRPAGADPDHDGRVCEDLPAHPAGAGASCTHPRRVVRVTLDSGRYPATADHIHDAIARGEPAVVHIDRGDAAEHRTESLAGAATRPGYDRDEWPMAMTQEDGPDANIRLVPSADNRGAGSSIAGQLRDFCDGTAFRVAITR
jgi:Deoxyribonuclease NucA/NucB